MANLAESLRIIHKHQGSLGAAVVDINTGTCLAIIGGRTLDMPALSAFYASFLSNKEKIVSDMGQKSVIEEVIVTSSDQYHILYPLKIQILRSRKPESIFFFVVLTKAAATLAQNRATMKEIVATFAL